MATIHVPKTRGRYFTRDVRHKYDALRRLYARDAFPVGAVAAWFAAVDPEWAAEARRLAWHGVLTATAEQVSSPAFFARCVALRDAWTRPVAHALWEAGHHRDDPVANWHAAQALLTAHVPGTDDDAGDSADDADDDAAPSS